MAEQNFTKIPVFDGTNYINWRFRLFAYLDAKDCVEPTKNETKPPEMEDATWSLKCVKAKNFLINFVCDSQLELIKDEQSAFAMIQKLNSLYDVQDTQKKLLIQRQLLNFKLAENEDPNQFFASNENAIRIITVAL